MNSKSVRSRLKDELMNLENEIIEFWEKVDER
jgi:hypothetical protein